MRAVKKAPDDRAPVGRALSSERRRRTQPDRRAADVPLCGTRTSPDLRMRDDFRSAAQPAAKRVFSRSPQTAAIRPAASR